MPNMGQKYSDFGEQLLVANFGGKLMEENLGVENMFPRTKFCLLRPKLCFRNLSPETEICLMGPKNISLG